MNAVEELLANKGIPFKIQGQDYLIKCLNPEHEDNNPSCRVDRTTGATHCFSCGFRTNIFKYFNILVNITSIRIAKLKTKLNTLKTSMVGLNMLDNAIPYTHTFRGISAKTLKEFEAFYTDDPKYRLEDRIIFPIRDINNNIYTYIGRHTMSSGNPKYLFYPEHVATNLYPLKLTKRTPSLVLVEGIFDLLNLWDKGLKNVACAFGTSTLYKSAKDKLLPFKAQGIVKIYLMFDGDEAGQIAMKKLKPILEELEYEVEIVQLPEDEDPGSLSQEYVDSLRDYINEKDSNY